MKAHFREHWTLYAVLALMLGVLVIDDTTCTASFKIHTPSPVEEIGDE